MRDKRPVDELSIEELERVLAIKRREARQQQLQRMQRNGRMVTGTAASAKPTSIATPKTSMHPSIPVPNAAPNGAASHANGAIPATNGDNVPQMASNMALPRFEDAPLDSVTDALTPMTDKPKREAQNRAWKRFVNFSLLLVEVGAVVGLLVIMGMLFSSITRLEDETRNAQEIANATRVASVPTLAATPTLRFDRVVLPGGHTINEETGQGIPNFAEIPASVPAHLLPAVQQQLLAPVVARPEPTNETALAINIPRLNVDQTIVQGADWEALQQGVGQVLNGFTPADPDGNVVFAAHNDIYGELFRYLPDMEVGDEFYVQTQEALHTYVVTGYEVVSPTDVHVLESVGRATATLITCYPYQVNTQRYIVYADRVDA